MTSVPQGLHGKLIIAAGERHSSVWPEAKTFERSQLGFLQPEATIIRYGQGPKYMESHKT